MTKKELEEREIKLEAVAQAYQQLIEHFIGKCPVHLPSIAQLENVSLALFNAAEVREGIEDLVSFDIKYD